MVSRGEIGSESSRELHPQQQQQQQPQQQRAVAGDGGGLTYDPASGSLRYPKFTQLPGGGGGGGGGGGPSQGEKAPGSNFAAAGPIPASGGLGKSSSGNRSNGGSSAGEKAHGSCDHQSAGSSPRCVISKSILESSTSSSPSGSKSVSEMDDYSDAKRLIGGGHNRSSSPSSEGDDDGFFGSSAAHKSAASPGFRALDAPRGGNLENAHRQPNARGNGELGQAVYKMSGAHARSISSSAVDSGQKFCERRGGGGQPKQLQLQLQQQQQVPEPAEAAEPVYGRGGKAGNVVTAPSSPAMDGALSDSGSRGQSRSRARSRGRNNLRGSQSHELLSVSSKESNGWGGDNEGRHSIHSIAAVKNSPLDPVLESLMKASIMKDGNQFKAQQSQIAEKIEELKRKNGMRLSAQSHSFSHAGIGAFSFNQTHVVRVSDADFLDYDSSYDTASNSSFDFSRGGGDGKAPAHRAVLAGFARPTPSKWDDAEKWLSSEPPPARPKAKSGPQQGLAHGALAASKKAAFLNHAGRLIPTLAQLAKPAAALPAAASCSEASSSSGAVDLLSNDGDDATASSEPARKIDASRFVAKSNSDDDDPDAGGGGSTRFVFLPTASPRPAGFAARSRAAGGSPDRYPIDDLFPRRESGDATAPPPPLPPQPDAALRTEKPTSDSPPKEDAASQTVDAAKCEAPQAQQAAAAAAAAGAAPKVCMRDMGTAMTPVPSVEPSRAPTPVSARTPTLRSPSSSRPATPSREEPASSPISDGEKKVHYTDKELQSKTRQEILALGTQLGKRNITAWATKEEDDDDEAAFKALKSNVDLEEVKKAVIATRAAAWEESEQAKYMARFNREEAKILAWENHERAKAEAEMRRIEMKIERMRSNANEKLMNKLAATRRSAGDLRAAAAARRGEQASKTTQRAEHIRRTGKVPSALFATFCCV